MQFYFCRRCWFASRYLSNRSSYENKHQHCLRNGWSLIDKQVENKAVTVIQTGPWRGFPHC